MRCEECKGRGYHDRVSGYDVPCPACGTKGTIADHVPATALAAGPSYPAGSLRYVPQSDTDGETIGTDHFIVDRHGAEVCLARDEESGRLFAASPDLLDACEIAAEVLENLGTGGEWRAHAALMAAIKKAKGGA